MIIFVGNEEHGDYINDIAKKYGWESAFIKSDYDINHQTSEIFQYQNVKVIVYEIMQYTTPAAELADVIAKIQKANNAKVVIYGEGVSPESNIIMELRYRGIEDYIFGWTLSEKKEQLIACIEGTGEKLALIDDMEPEENEEEVSKAKTVGVAGAVPRIGTTTQAIQLVKYLMLQGYKACYIQMNEHGWVEELIDAYADVEVDKEIGKAVYKSVDLFYRLDKLSEVLKLNYDYYVYDYGVYWERGFQKISFLEKDLKIFVVGVKPGEFKKTYRLIENNFYQDVQYIFSFIPEDEEEYEDTYELMGDKKEVTYFATDCRDPFVYSGSEIYKKLLPVEQMVKETAKEKRRFFRKRR